MSAYGCFLRGINVGGHKRVKMADLRAALAATGFRHVQTLVQSGNVLLHTDDDDQKRIASGVRSAVQTVADVDCRVMVRSLPELRDLVARNPFEGAAASNPQWLLVTLLETTPSDGAIDALGQDYRGPEDIAVIGSEVFVFYREGVGRSKLTPALLERHLGPGTARNWRTMTRMMEMAGSLDD